MQADADRSDELRAVIERGALTVLFQPILDLSGRGLFGFEALTRGPPDSPLADPVALFSLAERIGLLDELENLTQGLALRQWHALGLPGRIFLNLSPMSLLQGEGQGLLTRIEELDLDPERVVVELSERYPVEDYSELRQALEVLRRAGCRIAIDDLGAGYSGLRSWSELRPDYVKIDIHFIQGIDDDTVKRHFVQSMQEMAHGMGCLTIAEGVETTEEYAVVVSLGITLVQGHFFGRPHRAPTHDHIPEHFDSTALRQRQATLALGETVASLAESTPTVSPQTRTDQVMEIFAEHPSVPAIVVVDNNRPVGLVERNGLLQVFAGRYGRDLFARKPIALLMNTEPVIVDEAERLEVVSEIITSTSDMESVGRFIITRQGQYLAVGAVLNLLRRITDLRVHNARYANPLTLLPGNVPIAETIDRLIAMGSTFTVCYFDIDNFKPYNDTYGYDQGDRIIRLLANILVDIADIDLDFIGHVGGDDFIVIFRSADWQARVMQALALFDEQRMHFYSAQHLAQGGIYARDRRGEPVFFPLVTVSAGAVPVAPGRELTHHEVAQLASEAKAQAKRQDGASLFVDRRGRILPIE